MAVCTDVQAQEVKGVWPLREHIAVTIADAVDMNPDDEIPAFKALHDLVLDPSPGVGAGPNEYS